jgi:hypothetical protein
MSLDELFYKNGGRGKSSRAETVEKIRKIVRARPGIKQYEIARELGVNERTVSYYFHKYPELKDVIR